jgi:hypothetical protein
MRGKHQKKLRIQALVQTADLATYAAELRPIVTELRALAEDATACPTLRVHSRPFLRKRILRKLREVEARLDAALAAAPENDGCPVAFGA